MVNEQETNHHSGSHISVTSLQHCIRQVYLERTEDYAIEPKFGIWQSLRGTLIHAMFETPSEPDRFLCEVDYVYEFNGIKVHGRLDMYDKVDRILYDFKTQNDFGYLRTLKNQAAKEDHVWQTNFYRYLLEKGIHVPKKYEKPLGNFPVDKIVIIYMSMQSVLGTDTEVYEYDNRTGKVNLYAMADVPLLSHAKIRSYVRPRAAILDRAFRTGTIPAPTQNPDDHRWLCGFGYKNFRGYCAVRSKCEFWRKAADEEGIGYDEKSQ